ncbi:hypothetical protein [Jannaschia sp. M317]|uniref:hypothetical protein n=1 Tax=Jannaschia sp. M317 TaxID=2867011 RepID=UPI0021A7EE28|nr:hypothetical protein [Jannaschia sp. M317]UWQ19283.1 hypothetical protein K3551_08455 [Jannaschia sp. M317]
MRYDPREIEVHDFEPYNQDHFAWLRETLKLTEAESVALEAGLKSAAKDWKYRCLGLGRLSAAETKAFTKLSKALAATVESLKDVELDSWRRLQSCHAAHLGHQYSANLSFSNDDDWRPDVSLTLEYDPSDLHRRGSYDLDELNVVLDNLLSVVDIGTVRWSGPRGPKPNDDLPPWLRRIAWVWEKDVGRRFTRQFHGDGEPISEAAVLSLYAYRVLDPSIRSSDIDREMKEVIRVRNGGEWRA